MTGEDLQFVQRFFIDDIPVLMYALCKDCAKTSRDGFEDARVDQFGSRCTIVCMICNQIVTGLSKISIISLVVV